MKKKKTTDQSQLTEVIWTPVIRLWYVIHLLSKFVLEIVFIYLFYLLQQQQSKKSGWAAWHVPEKYICTHGGEEDNAACSQNGEIPCWVSRPWEKMIMMWYMLIVFIASAILVFVEIIWVITKISVKSNKRKKERQVNKQNLLLAPPKNNIVTPEPNNAAV